MKPLIQGLDVDVFFSSLIDREIRSVIKVVPSQVSAGYKYEVTLGDALTYREYELVRDTLGNLRDIVLKELKLTGGIGIKILIMYSVRDQINIRMKIKDTQELLLVD
mgnify:CR=1 FL=1